MQKMSTSIRLRSPCGHFGLFPGPFTKSLKMISADGQGKTRTPSMGDPPLPGTPLQKSQSLGIDEYRDVWFNQSAVERMRLACLKIAGETVANTCFDSNCFLSDFPFFLPVLARIRRTSQALMRPVYQRCSRVTTGLHSEGSTMNHRHTLGG